jgi:hypothetical protein
MPGGCCFSVNGLINLGRLEAVCYGASIWVRRIRPLRTRRFGYIVALLKSFSRHERGAGAQHAKCKGRSGQPLTSVPGSTTRARHAIVLASLSVGSERSRVVIADHDDRTRPENGTSSQNQQLLPQAQVLRHQRRPRPTTGPDSPSPPREHWPSPVIFLSQSGGWPSHFVKQN